MPWKTKITKWYATENGRASEVFHQKPSLTFNPHWKKSINSYSTPTRIHTLTKLYLIHGTTWQTSELLTSQSYSILSKNRTPSQLLENPSYWRLSRSWLKPNDQPFCIDARGLQRTILRKFRQKKCIALYMLPTYYELSTLVATVYTTHQPFPTQELHVKHQQWYIRVSISSEAARARSTSETSRLVPLPLSLLLLTLR